jgi:quercetin 2,3-dioxygenase
MSKQITRSDERMHTDIDWLNSRHSFSFGGHYDPERMGFGPLRVVNDDIVAPGKGFGSHPHKDMEIISLVLDGQLEHKDSMGNGRVIQTGDIQYMSAGTGLVHSEFNPSPDKPVHFMQIWFEPRAKGLPPRYADQPIIGEIQNAWKLLLSPDGRDGSIEIRQDAELRSVQLTPGSSLPYATAKVGRGFWVFVIEGEVEVAGDALSQGDSSAIAGVEAIEVRCTGSVPAKLLVFDVPLE